MWWRFLWHCFPGSQSQMNFNVEDIGCDIRDRYAPDIFDPGNTSDVDRSSSLSVDWPWTSTNPHTYCTEVHEAEKTKLLVMQLCDAKNLIEQEKGIAIAEGSWQVHKTMEKKKQEIAQLCAQIKYTSEKGEESKHQKEKSWRVALINLRGLRVLPKRKRESGKNSSSKEMRRSNCKKEAPDGSQI